MLEKLAQMNVFTHCPLSLVFLWIAYIIIAKYNMHTCRPNNTEYTKLET